MRRLRNVLLVVVAILLIWLLLREINMRNAFDEMYYGHYHFSNRHWTATSYRDVGLSPRSRGPDLFPTPGVLRELFNRSFLDSGDMISVQWTLKKKVLEIRVSSFHGERYDEYQSERLIFVYTYDQRRKRLVYQPLELSSDAYEKEEGKILIHDPTIISEYMHRYSITREDIARHNDFILFESILPRWFEANEGKTRFSMENLGRLEIINNQFPDE